MSSLDCCERAAIESSVRHAHPETSVLSELAVKGLRGGIKHHFQAKLNPWTGVDVWCLLAIWELSV